MHCNGQQSFHVKDGHFGDQNHYEKGDVLDDKDGDGDVSDNDVNDVDVDDGWKSSALVGVEEIACGLFTALATAKLSSRCTKYYHYVKNKYLQRRLDMTGVTTMVAMLLMRKTSVEQ